MMTRDVLEEKQTHIEKIHTNDNGSDMMTKCLSREKLQVFKQKEKKTEIKLKNRHLREREA